MIFTKLKACRKEVLIDMHGVHALPRNLVVEQLIEKIEKKLCHAL